MTATLVGRDRQMRTLRTRLSAAIAGRGALVMISGETGVGKTALADALCRDGEAAGARVLTGRCYDQGVTPPFGPWAELLEIDVAASQPEVFIRALDLLAAQSDRRPLVLLLEDLHWADPESVRLVRVAARRATRSRLLLLVTFVGDALAHDHSLNRLLPLIQHESRVERIELGRLAPEALRELVDARYSLPEGDAERLVGHVDSLAGGNALFTMEVLRALEEDEVLRRQETGWVLGEPDPTHVPRGPRHLVDARLRRLDEAGQSLLRTAAVLGPQVSVGSWALVTGRDERSLVPTIEAATAAQLIEQAPDGASFRFVHGLVREAIYQGISPVRRRAEHRRVADVLAAQPAPEPDVVAYHLRQAGDERATRWLILAGDRAERSGASLTAAARYLAALGSKDSNGIRPEQRAWACLLLALLQRFRTPREAFVWIAEADRLAADIGDPRLTARVPLVRGMLRVCADGIRAGLDDVNDGIALVERLAPAGAPPGYATVEPTSEQRVDLAVNRGVLAAMLSWLGRLGEARDQYERAFADGDPAARASAGWAAGFSSALRGEPDRSGGYFAQARAGLEALGDYRSLAFVARDELSYLVLPYLADQPDRRAESAAAAKRAVELGAAAGSIDEPAVYANYPVLPLMVLEGRWRDARDTIDQLLAHGPNPIARRVLAGFLAPLAREQGDTDLARRLVADVWPAGPETGVGDTDVYYTLPLQRLAAAIAIDAGDLDAARSWLAAHDRWLAWSGTDLGRSESESSWSRCFAAAGDPRRALARAERALAQATRPHQPLALLVAHRRLGGLALRAGRLPSAERHLAAALALTRSCGAPHERALTLTVAAELALANGDTGHASMALAEARTICRRLGAVRTLAGVDRLIAELGGAAADRPAGLTGREAEVLGLLAQGRSNKEIAARLDLSVRTVERHITSCYRKIGARRRTEAMAFALMHGLARIDRSDGPAPGPDLT